MRPLTRTDLIAARLFAVPVGRCGQRSGRLSYSSTTGELEAVQVCTRRTHSNTSPCRYVWVHPDEVGR